MTNVLTGLESSCLFLLFHLIFLMPAYILLFYVGMEPIQTTLQQCLSVPASNLTFVFTSIICIFLCVLICFREMYVFGFAGMILLSWLKAELFALYSHSLMKSEFVSHRYIRLRLQHLRIEKAFSLGTAGAVLFCLVMHCAVLCMVCSFWMLIPAYMSVAIVVILTVSLVIVLFALRTESDCQVSSQNMVTKHLDGSHVYGIQGGFNDHLKRIWKGQLPLRIYCGRQFVVGRDACMNYMDALSSILTNSVRIIKI